jgi:glyoxylase-like metal-dependent hydrolase (beta-lactamase superfamily II)
MEGSCISYFVCCPGTGVAAVIDPSRDLSQYLAQAKAEGCQITHVIDTHIHADHVSGARDLVRALGVDSELCMTAGADTSFEYTPLRDGDEIEVGQVALKIMSTPGHTQESISLLYTDKKRAAEPWAVFTGDALFVGDVGRLDLMGHGTLEEAFNSLRKLLSLPDYVEIYPAHYAGSDCASNSKLSFKTVSTIGYERRFNKMLAWDDFQQFESLLQNNAVPIPPMWRGIKLYNQGRRNQIDGIHL